jgi:hypothetical protein
MRACDFHNIESNRDVAADALGTDRKPVYRAPTNTLATFGKGYFDQWYHDVQGINLAVTYPLTLSLTSDGSYEYDGRKKSRVKSIFTRFTLRSSAPSP